MKDDRPITAKRLEQLLIDRGESQEDLAEILQVSQSAISQIITGKTRRSRLLPLIAEKMAVNLGWLLGTTDERIDMFDVDGESISEADLAQAKAGLSDRKIAFRGAEPERHRDAEGENVERAPIVWLKEVEQVLGAGGGFFDGGGEERLVPFPEHWLRNSVQASVKSLVTMPIKGTSMEPTILDGNLCIIDTSRKQLDEQDEIWACAYGGIAVIKRLRQMPDGTVKLMSDNRTVRDEIASDGDLFILGRCVNVLRST